MKNLIVLGLALLVGGAIWKVAKPQPRRPGPGHRRGLRGAGGPAHGAARSGRQSATENLRHKGGGLIRMRRGRR